VLARVRKICLSFPEVTERPSHGAPAFFVRGKTTFVQTTTTIRSPTCGAPPALASRAL